MTGLRFGELAGLTVDRVNFIRKALTVDRQWTADGFGPPKSSTSYGDIPLSKEVPCPQWLNERAVLGVRKPLANWLGRPVTPHDLRHFYASALIRQGADVKLVQARLGHKSAQTTIDIYGHLWPDSDERTRTAIDAVFDRPLARTVDGDAGMAAERGL
jgi:integrase